MSKFKWFIYVPEQGDFEIQGADCHTYEEVRQIYLKWAGRKRLPKHATIWSQCQIGGGQD